MAQLDFTSEASLNLDAPIVSQIKDPSYIDKEVSAYASMLVSEDPKAEFKVMLDQFKYNGQSENLKSALNLLKVEENKDVQKSVAALLESDLPAEEKKGALLYYQQNRDVAPDLRSRFSMKVAAANEDTSLEADIGTAFLEKEQAIDELQKEKNSFGATLSGSVLSGVGGLLLEIAPFAGAWFKGFQLSELQKAVDGKDYGFLESVWNGIWQGDTEEKLRTTLNNIPTTEGKRQAALRIMDTIKEMPGTDYNKYTAIMSSLDGSLEDWEKTLTNIVGVVGAAFGVGAVASQAVKMGTRSVRVGPSVNPNTVIGRAAAHNPSLAGNLGGQAIVDETGDIAAAIGARGDEIVADILPKVSSEVTHALGVEATASLKATVDGIDASGVQALKNTERSYILYEKEMIDGLNATIQNTIQGTKSAAVHLGKSTFNVTEKGISGIATFGKTDTTAFQSYDEALAAAKELAPELPEGAVTIVKRGRGGKLRPAYSTTTTKGDHYLQFNYAKEVTPQDIVLYGPDAVRIKFDLFGKEVTPVSNLLTRLALSGGKVGQYIFAHHAMPAKAASAAFVAFDKALAVEEPFLTAARRFVSAQSEKERGVVADLLKEGEEFNEAGVLGKVFKYDEVIKKGLAKGLSQSEAEKAAEGYFVYRRLADWMYTLSDRAKTKQLRKDGYSWITPNSGERFIGQQVSRGAVDDVRTVLDKATGNVVPITKKELDLMYEQGESLVRMAYPLRNGDVRVDFARVGKSFKEQELTGGTLPYIRGYVPRGYDNNYFVVRTPNKVDVNGNKLDGASQDLSKFRTTHYASDSLMDVRRKVAELQKADPTGKYDWKRERLSERTVLEQADVFRQNMIHSSHRGKETLEGGNQRDPLVSLISLIQSVSKKAAMEEFLQITKADFVKQYGDFLVEKGKFPTGLDQIIAKPNMTGAEAGRLKQAKAVYNWLEGMMVMQRYDSALWKDMMYGAGEFAEKFSPLVAKMLRGAGEHYPLDYLRKISTALFISLRPARQILLQPSQLMLYPSLDAKLLNPIEASRFVSKIGALGLSKFYRNKSSLGEMIPDELIIKTGARMFRQTEDEFKKTLESFQQSGLLQSIDTNLLVDGLYSQKHKKLVETFGERLGRNVEGTLGALPRLGRQVGFDRGEEINLAGSWIIARDRFAKMNPDVDINSRFASESIAATTRELTFSMTRPGAFQYQKNALAMPLQFIAAPHKALLGFTTSKTLTAPEKARLMAAHFILYGSAGLGIQQFVSGEKGLNLRGEYGNVLGEEFFLALDGGLADWGANTLIGMLFDEEGEETRMNFSGSFSPLSGGILPIGDFLNSLSEDPFAVTLLGPSWNIVDPQKGRLITAIRDIAAMMRGDEDTEVNFKDVVLRATELTSGGTDWMKYRFARDMDLIVSSNGHVIEQGITAAEAVGKIFGLATINEGVYYEQLKRFKDEEGEIKKAAQYLAGGFLKRSALYKDDPTAFQRYNAEVSAYMSTIQDPTVRLRMQKEFNKIMDYQTKTLGQSVKEQVYYGAASVSSDQLRQRFNTLESYGMKEQADTIRNLMGVEE